MELLYSSKNNKIIYLYAIIILHIMSGNRMRVCLYNTSDVKDLANAISIYLNSTTSDTSVASLTSCHTTTSLGGGESKLTDWSLNVESSGFTVDEKKRNYNCE